MMMIITIEVIRVVIVIKGCSILIILITGPDKTRGEERMADCKCNLNLL